MCDIKRKRLGSVSVFDLDFGFELKLIGELLGVFGKFESDEDFADFRAHFHDDDEANVVKQSTLCC